MENHLSKYKALAYEKANIVQEFQNTIDWSRLAIALVAGVIAYVAFKTVPDFTPTIRFVAAFAIVFVIYYYKKRVR